jgi:adenylate kinase
MPDEPIVVTGGSVTIDFKDTLQHQTSAPSGMLRYTIATGTLVSVVVNGDKVADLNKEDVVQIIYTTD